MQPQKHKVQGSHIKAELIMTDSSAEFKVLMLEQTVLLWDEVTSEREKLPFDAAMSSFLLTILVLQ